MPNLIEQSEEFSTELFESAVRVVSTRRPEAELLKIARDRAYDPTIFDESKPIFFGVEFTSNNLDCYFTRMAPDTINNYVTAAAAGVSFQDSHRTRELGLGRSLFSEQVAEGDLIRGFADVFTLPGLPDMDQFIFKYRAGIARDVSVGFFGGKFICSLCNRSIWSWDCPHVPGVEYDIEETDAQGNVTNSGRVLAFAWVRGAQLSEISAVYKGATPGCAILKAQREAGAGRMTPEIANLLEARYRGLQLTGAHRRWAGADLAIPPAKVSSHSLAVSTQHSISEKGVTSIMDKQNQQETDPTISQPGDEPSPGATRAPGTALSTTSDTASPNEPERLVADLITTAGLPAEVSGDLREVSAHLRQMVQDGKAYRTRVITDALTAGVRLFGNEFDKDGTEALFARAPVEQVRKMGDQWAASADKLYPAGRQTVDEAPADEKPEPVRIPAVPASVYGG